MPAGPVGSTWAVDAWIDTAWAAGSWADAQAGVTPPSYEYTVTFQSTYTNAAEARLSHEHEATSQMTYTNRAEWD